MLGLFWLGMLVGMIVIELVTLGLTTIWFAGGALAAFLVNLAGGGLLLQILVFFLVSIVMLIFTRPLAQKYININRVKTNAESLIGNTGIVTDEIDNLRENGAVKINGQEWTARAVDGSRIEKDKIVIIEDINGVKLMVKERKMEVEK